MKSSFPRVHCNCTELLIPVQHSSFSSALSWEIQISHANTSMTHFAWWQLHVLKSFYKCNNSVLLFNPFSSTYFVRASKGELVPFALLHLLHCLLSKSPSVAGAAYTEIRALAAAKAIKLQAFFSQYKKPICQVKRVWFRKCIYLGSLCIVWKWKSRSKLQYCSKWNLIGQERNYFKEKTLKNSGTNGKSLTFLCSLLNSVASLLYFLDDSFWNRGSCIL